MVKLDIKNKTILCDQCGKEIIDDEYYETENDIYVLCTDCWNDWAYCEVCRADVNIEPKNKEMFGLCAHTPEQRSTGLIR